MMKQILLSFSLLFLFGKTIAQDSIGLKAFLNGIYQEESVTFHHKRLQFFNSQSNVLPYVEKLEVRTETNEFDWRKQEYLLRISPNTKKNIKTQRQHQETVKYLFEMEMEAALGRALRERYEMVLNHHFLTEILDVKKKQQILFKDKVLLLRRSTALPNFEMLDLIEAEDEEQENIRDILDLENAILTLGKQIQRRIANEAALRIGEEAFISVEDLKKNIPKLQPDPGMEHIQLNVLSAKTYNKMLEYEWEAAKYQFSLGYIQAKYGYDKEDSFQKSFSIGIGFDIPLRAEGRLDLNELQIDILKSESDYNHMRNDLSEKKNIRYQNLLNLIKKHDLVSLQLTESQAEFALKEYRKIAEVPAKALLKLRENTLNKELLLKKIELQIMQVYIEYLDFSGWLSQKPKKNLLTLPGTIGQ